MNTNVPVSRFIAIGVAAVTFGAGAAAVAPITAIANSQDCVALAQGCGAATSRTPLREWLHEDAHPRADRQGQAQDAAGRLLTSRGGLRSLHERNRPVKT